MADVTLLCSDRLILRPPRAADAQALAKHANDRNVWINLRDHFPHPYSLEEAHRWIATIQDQDPRVTFFIDLDGEAIGGIGLVLGKDIERCSAEVGYWLSSQYWGRGITTSALERICRYAFEQLGLIRLFATPLAWNPASFRVLEKAGFRKEGVMQSAAIKDDKVVDMVLFAKVTDA